jgi:hypothetical protein
MKTFTSIKYAIVILLSLSSCTSLILVQKTYDPEIDLKKTPYKIVLVNLFDYTSPAIVKEKRENTFHTGIMKFTEGLSSSFSRIGSFGFLCGDTLKKDITADQLTAILPKDSIIAICKRNNSNMLLTLDSVNIFVDWETVVNYDDDHKEKIKNFYLHTRFYLSLYSVTGDLLKRSKMEESSLFESNTALSALITIKPSFAEIKGPLQTLSFKAGQEYVSKFYPRTVQESRTIYAGKVFKESNLYIKLRNWEKATELLDQLAKSTDPDIAMKAIHNLSVVKEAAALEN